MANHTPNDVLYSIVNQYDNLTRQSLNSILLNSYSKEQFLTAKQILISQCEILNLTNLISNFKKTRISPNTEQKLTKDILDIWDVIDREKGGKLDTQFVPSNPAAPSSLCAGDLTLQDLFKSVVKLQHQNEFLRSQLEIITKSLTAIHHKLPRLEESFSLNQSVLPSHLQSPSFRRPASPLRVLPQAPVATPFLSSSSSSSSVAAPADTDATPVESEATPTETDATPAETLETPAATESTPAAPKTTPVALETTESTPAAPESTPAAPESTPTAPKTTPAALETTESTPAAPDTTPVAPETITAPPETTPAPKESAPVKTPVTSDVTTAAADVTPAATDETPAASDETPGVTDISSSANRRSYSSTASDLVSSRANWTLAKARNKRKIVPVIGRAERIGDDDLEGVAPVKNYAELSISRLKDSVTSDKVKSHLHKHGIEVRDVFILSSKINGTKSAKVRVAVEQKERAKSPDIWPQHCRVADWVNFKKKAKPVNGIGHDNASL